MGCNHKTNWSNALTGNVTSTAASQYAERTHPILSMSTYVKLVLQGSTDCSNLREMPKLFLKPTKELLI
jgi:hypothetical protein